MNPINGEHKVLIAGGTGLIGNRLCELLSSKGMKVVLLSRTPKANAKYPAFKWDPAKDILDPA
jgi:hypothetical protein